MPASTMFFLTPLSRPRNEEMDKFYINHLLLYKPEA